MNLQDPVADMLARIRNAAASRHETVLIPASRHKEDILKVFAAEGYIKSYAREAVNGHPALVVRLAYMPDSGEPVVKGLRRVSRPGRRVYARSTEIPKVLSGLGHSILSTSKGVMTGHKARRLKLGGEILCEIW